MKNMGLSDLRLVSPSVDDEAALLARAVHAADVWEGSQTFVTLEAALADCALAVGTSRRRGHKRKSVTLSPHELALYLVERGGKAALVFGNERTGLETPELSLCNLASHIDAAPVFPSLNLSHAVQIYAYELRCALPHDDHRSVPKGLWTPLDRAETDALVQSLSARLEASGFFRHPGRVELETFLRDLISRAGLSKDEARYLGNNLAKALRLGKETDVSNKGEDVPCR
jgi:tRNA/rRNA methyltransferase/tRNA (cytidine32/uridine32-2'-O)-methyltransferase